MRKEKATRFMQQQVGKLAGKKAFDEEGKPTPALEKAVLSAVQVQRPLVLANLRRLRRKHPEWSTEQLARKIASDYTKAVTAGGAAAGAAAIVPGLGTLASLALSAGITVGFLEASALYVQSIAELHGISTKDPQRAQTIVMATLLGEDGKALITQFTAQSAALPGGAVNLLPALGGKSISGYLAEKIKRRFLRKMLVRQGSSFIGRAFPFGVGAVIGGVGNHLLAKRTIESAGELFGPLPQVLPGELVRDMKQLKGADQVETPGANQGPAQEKSQGSAEASPQGAAQGGQSGSSQGSDQNSEQGKQ